MEHFVKVPNFSGELRIPDDQAERFRHDREGKRLIFQGAMSKADFDRLSTLSDDWAYRRPLEELFRLSLSEEPRKRGFARLLSALHLGF